MTTVDEAVTLTTALEELVSFIRRMPVEPAMSMTEVTALRGVAIDGPMRVSDIAERLGVSQPGATQLVDRLARAGQVERLADDNDGRVVLVRVTAAGRELLAARHRSRDRLLAELVTQLPAADQRRIAAAVRPLLALIRTREGQP